MTGFWCIIRELSGQSDIWYFFQEFLDTVVLFSSAGGSDDKLRIIFDMCDTNENGLIEKKELQEQCFQTKGLIGLRLNFRSKCSWNPCNRTFQKIIASTIWQP
jgi:hypothetical protein